jgi:hypothetical protein
LGQQPHARILVPLADAPKPFVISAQRPRCATVKTPLSHLAMFPRLNSRQDRRHRKRQLLNTSVRVITKLASMDALGINISPGGMGLFTIANLPLGSRIEVEFRTSEGPAPFSRVAGTVRHRALYLYGIEFNPESGATGLDAEGSSKSESSTSALSG